MTSFLIESIPADVADQLDEVMGDPVMFGEAIFGTEMWEMQRRILRAVKRASEPDATSRERRIAVKACHASSKTFTAAEAALWWVTRFPNGIVITTAPTWIQVERLIWGEIHSHIARASIAYPEPNKTDLPLGPDNYILGISTNEGARFQGWHGHILIVVDEAPGVLGAIFEAIEGIRAGGIVVVLLLGNPIMGSGYFFDAYHVNRERWTLFTISAFDTPNLRKCYLEYTSPTTGEKVLHGDPNGRDLLKMTPAQLARSPRAYLTNREWVREKYEEWGPENPLFESKVLGQFPSHSEDALIPLSWIEMAAIPVVGIGTEEPIDGGIDVAGPGKAETVLTLRRGPNIVLQKGWPDPDPRGKLLVELSPWRGVIRNLNIDSIGQGYYFAKHVEDAGYPVSYINVGLTARDDEMFFLKKSEWYWGLRIRFQKMNIGNVAHPKTISQLATLRYKLNERGQVVMEKKEAMLKRGVKSPDWAESTMLAYIPPGKSVMEKTRTPGEGFPMARR